MAINMAAIPENLIESEFFGYRKGAFTGADSDYEGKFIACNEGTIFLDEEGKKWISYIAWEGEKPIRGHRAYADKWGNHEPAAIMA